MNKKQKKINKMWLGIGLFIFVFIVVIFFPSDSSQNNELTESKYIPTEREFEIDAYWEKIASEEEKKLYDYQESIPYESYDNVYLTSRVEREIKEFNKMEDRVMQEVANEFGISVKELDDILLNVTFYRYVQN